MRRREWLVGTSALGAVAAFDLPAHVPHMPRRPPLDRVPTRIAFGSCADQDKAQPIWDAINALQPELFIFLGDNIYGDTRDMRVLRAKYRKLARQPGFRRLCERTPVLAVWDDHDYGEDDAGAEYPMRRQSQKVFCDFWAEPVDSARRRRDGIYDSISFSHGGRTLQVVLPDLRFNRTALLRKDSYVRGALGPYLPQTSPSATMLGEDQWRWLETTLRTPADLRIFASSLQVVADATGWESWINFPDEHARLLQTIRRAGAHGLFCISGDMHYGELSCLEEGAPYPLWDLTSSGLTEVWPERPPNRWRRNELLHEANFGWIEIDWPSEDLGVTLQVRDVRGEVRIEQRIHARQLRVADGST